MFEALIMLVQLLRTRGEARWDWGEDGGREWQAVRLIAAALYSTTETWDHHKPSATMSAPAKPRCCSHFPWPPPPGNHITLTQPYTQTQLHTHMLNHKKATKCFLTAEPQGTNTNRDLNSTGFTGLWKQQHFGVATAYIRLYLTHIMATRKGKFTHFKLEIKWKISLLDALLGEKWNGIITHCSQNVCFTCTVEAHMWATSWEK